MRILIWANWWVIEDSPLSGVSYYISGDKIVFRESGRGYINVDHIEKHQTLDGVL